MASISKSTSSTCSFLKKSTSAAVLFLALNSHLFATEKLEFQREDGSLMTAYFDSPDISSFPIAILIQGSQKESASGLHDSLKNSFSSIAGVLTLEKKGMPEKELKQIPCLDERLNDHTLAIQKLKSIKGWDGKLILIGQGEGGKIGASIAAEQDSVLALVAIAAGGAWSAEQEALASFSAEMAGEQYPPLYIHNFMVQAREQFQNAVKKPSDDHQAFGFSYKYWNALMKRHLAADLQKANCPIYYIHGDLDDRIPKGSVDALAEFLKEKSRFTCVRKGEAGHEILSDSAIYNEAIDWLKSLQLQKN